MSVAEITASFPIEAFREDLISWYKDNKRDLPWRKDQDPYKVWVSEIMLQQTRVDTVIPYFQRFLAQFPTLEHLAQAEEEKVLKAWEGLGYYSRVRNLQTAVKEVSTSYGGQVPSSPEKISKLKGVGPYTAGAILSIAYGIPEPAVDGNVMRVLSRILIVEDDIAKAKTRVLFETLVRELISKEDPSSFNQALMELGALICTPQSPACLLCPVQAHCRAFEQGRQKELPVKVKKIKVKTVDLAAVLLRNQEGRYLIHRRPSEGLLANLWEFPNLPVRYRGKDEEQTLVSFLESEWEVEATIGEAISRISHIFSHLKWDIQLFTGYAHTKGREQEDLRWVTLSEMEQYPFSVSHQKIIKLAKEVE
ncbi:A/G-specific adenine glycosylase [Fictibacillus macauensis ZFHKF-1]|uniref:Adenine DNA glycosylase n=1 Tax=Fictibacillus macauensis ZFHKF-1 TaxID=1196324 RepID=I8UCZ6_9BACL|nr:A/G-specific adenine glycosylase [Fictibacillus macauensis]EIT84668.1 A/G-specific adenine glycosylase [Fictibacillus macauensis ZFHKF-1]